MEIKAEEQEAIILANEIIERIVDSITDTTTDNITNEITDNTAEDSPNKNAADKVDKIVDYIVDKAENNLANGVVDNIDELADKMTEEVLEKAANEIADEISNNASERNEAAETKEDNQTRSQKDNLILQNNNESKSTSSEETLKEVIELINKCKDFYKNHKIEEAHRIIKKFDLIKENMNQDDLIVLEQLLSQDEDIFEEIERENSYLNKILEELINNENWKTEQLDKRTKLSYKKGSNELLTIKMEAEIEVPLLHLISMINEVELWRLWNPIMNQTAEVASIHRGARVYYVEYGLPYPLSNREIHLYGVGVNRLYENGTIVIMAQSVDNDVEFFKKHNIKKYEHKGAINIDVHLGGFEITPIGRNKCLLKGITNINPKFDWLPNNIMNWVLKKGTKQMVDKIAAGAMKFKGSAWEKEIKSEKKRGFYEWLEYELEDYHNKISNKSSLKI